MKLIPSNTSPKNEESQPAIEPPRHLSVKVVDNLNISYTTAAKHLEQLQKHTPIALRQAFPNNQRKQGMAKEFDDKSQKSLARYYVKIEPSKDKENTTRLLIHIACSQINGHPINKGSTIDTVGQIAKFLQNGAPSKVNTPEPNIIH